MACHFPFTVILFEYQSLSVPLYIPAEPSYLNSDRQIKEKRAFFHLKSYRSHIGKGCSLTACLPQLQTL